MQRGADRADEARAFLDGVGWGDALLFPLPGDASTRHYTRAVLGERRAMLMDQPQNAEQPPCPPGASAEERRALGYNAIARLAGSDCARFIAAAEYLRSKGLSAPAIYAADVDEGFVLIEDLGDDLYTDALANGAEERALYGNAIDALVRLQLEPAPKHLTGDKPLYPYDETAQIAEVDLMTEWFIPVALGRAAHEAEVEEHRALWREVLRVTVAGAPVFVHRDFHAHNLMWIPGRTGAQRVGVIDFQDAVAGNRSYDLVSLLEDARRDVSADMAEAMSERYLDGIVHHASNLDRNALRAEMAVMAAQRNTKIAGIFARLFRRDGKPRYLEYLPRVWGYLNRDLEHPALAHVKKWYDRTIPLERRTSPRLPERVA
jgi:aminoglycoside/choline kinase family phosphotransferase